MSNSKPSNKASAGDKGKLRVDIYTLKRLMVANGWSLEDFCRETGVTKQTGRRLMNGGPARMATLRTVAHDLGVEPIDLIDPSEYERPAAAADNDSSSDTDRSEWSLGRALTEVQTASNGLQYRIFRMQHRYQRTRFGRGKRYEFAHLADDAQEQLLNRFIRHTEVCDRIRSHPQIPICFATYPESKEYVWWVIDEWVDGASLANRLTEDSVPLKQAARWACELASGLSALHQVEIVRRELNPENVLVREPDESLLLTDFELAKLSGNLPTVSEVWPEDPYRAPEIGAGTPTPAADIYSWGRVVTHMIVGELPGRGSEAAALTKRTSKKVVDALVVCTAQRQSQRPQSFDELLPVFHEWRDSLG